ncbi:hypothetical protein DBIPINDM_008357 (plasmid) [Mesorhizobium sp. AR02]|uniref:hypothetical protein n=1 Tax=Mesorhizobium sp. AR02 TaxID=2865837 RepID=UPI002160E4F8|nr:hypothetical protein [Mesorhizobium sp. AR02]UVK57403.1 hypothetical protein DBIPINDM_008357 [Mesorhizobium sp. AR02]
MHATVLLTCAINQHLDVQSRMARQVMQQTESPDPIGRVCRACLRQTVVSFVIAGRRLSVTSSQGARRFLPSSLMCLSIIGCFGVFQVNVQQRNFHLWLAAAAVEFQ